LRDTYILDACALLAVINNEPGVSNVSNLILDALYDETIIIKMNKVNLLEVYYGIINTYGQDMADAMMRRIGLLPIEVIAELNDDVFREAGRIKSKYKIPLGDSLAAAECIIGKGTLVTSDHNDFEKVESPEKIKILWFR
jgi:predicted nucleic acid-binding protein